MSMPDSELSQLVRRFHALTGKELRVHYERACLIAEAFEVTRYGSRSLKSVAVMFNVSTEYVRRHRRVRACFPPEMFQALATEKDGKGRPMFTWSHLEEIARLPDAGNRGSLLDETRSKGYRAHNMKSVVSERLKNRRASRNDDAASMLGRLAESTAEKIRVLLEQVRAGGVRAPDSGPLLQHLLDQVQEALTCVQALPVALTRHLEEESPVPGSFHATSDMQGQGPSYDHA